MNSFLTPFKESYLIKICIAIVLFFYSLFSFGQVDKNSDLYKTLKSKDSIVFERAFNMCEVQKLESIIAKDIECYHHISGVQNREEFINAIKINLCSKPGVFTRKLIDSSLEVHQLKSNGNVYGAIQNGKHDFFIKENNKIRKTGTAQFTHLWVLENKTWKLKRVLSFDHKAATE